MAEHGTSFSLTITSHVSLSSDMRPVRTASIITFSILATLQLGFHVVIVRWQA